MTVKPRFENMWTIGNIITIISMVVAGLTAFIQVRADVQQLREIVMELKADNAAEEVRLRSVELGFGRVEERLVSMQTLLQQLVNRQENQR